MTFLRSAWYCVGFPHEFPAGGGEDHRGMKAITVLGEALVVFRRADGRLVALADRCPHRFAPLSRGRLQGDAIECPYHGLQFGTEGQCVHNPHGDGAVPKAAQVKSHAVTERYDLVWVWMGAADQADPSALPDLADIVRRPGWSRRDGYLKVKANYQLVTDNLLDLSHVQYLHPFIGGGGPPLPDLKVDIHMEQHGETVTAVNELIGLSATPMHQMLWPGGQAPSHLHLRANMVWTPPSVLMLDTGGQPIGGAREDGVSVPSAHVLTPETENTTHYFWVNMCDQHVDDDALIDRLAQGISDAFTCEDEPMIEAVYQRMGGADLWSLEPVLLPGDASAVRARRILAARIAAERQASR